MAMLGRKPFNPNAYVPPVDIASSPVQPMGSGVDLPDVPAMNAPPKHNWVGILADALSGLAGGPGLYAQRAFAEKQQQSAFDRGEQTYQRHRNDSLNDQLMMAQWRVQNKTDPLTDAMVAAGIDPKSPQGIALYAKRASTIADPPRFFTDPSGRTMMMGGGSSGTPAPPNITFTPLDDGGPSPDGSGGFL